MFGSHLRWRGRKRPGATLIEMLIAILILSMMLLSIMAVMVITSQNTVAIKQGSVAYIENLSELEKMESLQISGDLPDPTTRSSQGTYTLNRQITTSPLRSADIRIRAVWEGIQLMRDVTLGRQVSPSAWQNAGQAPVD